MGKAQLHELIAVEGDLKDTYGKLSSEALVTFEKRTEHFMGHTRTLTMKDALRQDEEGAGFESKALVSTVDEKLAHVNKSAVAYIDAVAQKEATNQTAKADLVVDGIVVAKDLPATLLLGLEDKIKKTRMLYEKIPTLQPGVEWVTDTSQRPGVYKAAHTEERLKTEQVIKHIVVVPPTDRHPAQIDKVADQVPVGVFRTEKTSGMITPADKAARMERLDKLQEAVKKARMRANCTEVVPVKIGQMLFDYIDKGSV